MKIAKIRLENAPGCINAGPLRLSQVCYREVSEDDLKSLEKEQLDFLEFKDVIGSEIEKAIGAGKIPKFGKFTIKLKEKNKPGNDNEIDFSEITFATSKVPTETQKAIKEPKKKKVKARG